MQICDAYGANRYPFPEDVARQRQMHSEVSLFVLFHHFIFLPLSNHKFLSG